MNGKAHDRGSMEDGVRALAIGTEVGPAISTIVADLSEAYT